MATVNKNAAVPNPNNLPLFKVASATESENGGFVTKLVHKAVNKVASAFGEVVQETSTTFYVKLAAAPKVGFEAPLDLSGFDVTERPYEIPELGTDGEPNENAGDIIMLKWLAPKRA
jgi:hypothetical protein